MIQKRLAMALGIFFICFSTNAQRLVTREFKDLPNDQTANLHGTTVKDQNGKTTALLKVFTPFPVAELGFGGTIYGVTKVEQHGPGEIWIYLPERSQKLTFVHPRYGEVTCFYESVGSLKGGRTYAVELTVEGKQVSLVASARGSEIEVDGQAAGVSPVNIYLPYGAHTVKATQGNFLYEDVISISKDGPDEYRLQMEDESLKYADVTFKVPEGVEIWFMNRREGVGEYTTRLREGQYSVETKKLNHAPVISSFVVKPGKSQTFYPDPPVPYKGFLEFTTIPETGVSVLNNDTVFTRDRVLNLPVGKYELTFEKKGYIPKSVIFDVRRGETVSDTIRLQRRQYVKTSTIYAGVGFVPLSNMGVNFHVGGVYRNVELEVGYTLGLDKSKSVRWFDQEDNLLAAEADYKVHEVNVTAGYRLRFAERFGLTPRLGWEWQTLSALKGAPGRNFNLSSLTIGVKALYQPVSHFGIYLTPQYGLPLSEKGDIKELCRLAGITRGGFGLNFGVEVNL